MVKSPILQQYGRSTKKKLEVDNRIKQKRFENLIVQRIKCDHFIKIRCTNPKDETLKVDLIRKKTGY